MEALAMSESERRRVEMFGLVRDGQLSVAAAAVALGVSERQAWRLKARCVAGGDGGLVHGLRGKPSNRKAEASSRSAVLGLYRKKYAGWGPTLACEYLAREDDWDVSHDTLGRWLRAEGLLGRQRKRGKHRTRRPRRERCGELLQMDGSWHDWFEGRGPWCCLMVLVDDATGRTWARFYDRETLAGSFDAFGRYAAAFGLPAAVYVDKAGIYRPDPDTGEPTQFGRAMAALGVKLILADSPQAKGRVERMNGTLQDQLVPFDCAQGEEMRLRGVGDMASANARLAGGFLADLNGRFAVAAKGKRPSDVHRRVTARMRLDEVLCVHEARAVGRDWCVQWRGRLLQVDARHAGLDLPRPERRVTVVEKADGTLLLRYGTETLTWREVVERPKKARPAKKPVANNTAWKPAADHPSGVG
jgi:transposase